MILVDTNHLVEKIQIKLKYLDIFRVNVESSDPNIALKFRIPVPRIKSRNGQMKVCDSFYRIHNLEIHLQFVFKDEH